MTARIAQRAATLVLCAAGAAAQAQAPAFDAAALERWEAATLVHYHAEGVFQQWTPVSHADRKSQGNVIQRITVDLDWDRKAKRVVGTPTIVSGKTEVAALRNADPPCKAPVLKGDFVFFDARALEPDIMGLGGLQLRGTRAFPAADVGTLCPGSLKLQASPAKQVEVTEPFPLVDGTVLAMGGSGGGLTVAADRKSYEMKGKSGWVWKVVPGLLK